MVRCAAKGAWSTCDAVRPKAVRDVLLELARRIRDARRAAGLTQEAAASRANIDYKRWQRLEEGTVNPTVQTLVRVADALGTDLWHLVGERKR
ncbi:MAG TPA: helix-turn-helix transcriptional regulator [Polyangiaceae bacterium]|nr:helix-turn-helix transcriptional regulator [Polyangiaceae bacterium]HNZ24226.1 helix-turn-helix transcriptional regulator [Polyangiaceae bacterium]HOD25419.1 helix-turn-helix transcriptional regulator [Polyangiaceae bacterium]HOH01139.1 helix-turn-helix transcriptional regulator [Polyangiaceae bacterium]HOR36415.1 helix-turn-helix transcriptional regulator [Polyangiaceae bacterium]